MKNINITQAELEVMRVLWDSSKPLSANEVIQALESKSHWKPITVRTFLNRLTKKGALKTSKAGYPGYEVLHFEPGIDESTALKEERQSVLSRFFGGTVQSMLASCIRSGEISTEELTELRKIIDETIRKEDS
ncbi:MAG: BlaI/MecI/CopY family transcriptional regulator [Thermoguttaceae bacterium]